MAFKTQPVTAEQFKLSKEKHQHHWTFLGKEKGTNPKYLLCRCDRCQGENWVMWRWISAGRSRNCKKCHKRPFLDQFNRELAEKGFRWKVHDLTKQITHANGQKARLYWCTCLDCNKSKWTAWSMLQQFTSKRCRNCANRKKITGKAAPPSPIEKDLLRRWHDFKWKKAQRHIPVSWKNFEEFKAWALSTDYSMGKRLTRKCKTGPYSSENCYWAETIFQGKYKNTGRNYATTEYGS